MELSVWLDGLGGLGGAWVDDALVWAVALLAALVGAAAFVNGVALLMDSDTEAG
ncbi:hypothetical protein [Variovorax rhizosphaerae]|uniref:Uncharacterized protein n=1 Tax=Variovorax rhizosphaerae TaxID=1836200 RepID=A0ABU8WP98_9BURK